MPNSRQNPVSTVLSRTSFTMGRKYSKQRGYMEVRRAVWPGKTLRSIGEQDCYARCPVHRVEFALRNCTGSCVEFGVINSAEPWVLAKPHAKRWLDSERCITAAIT